MTVQIEYWLKEESTFSFIPPGYFLPLYFPIKRKQDTLLVGVEVMVLKIADKGGPESITG